MKLRIYYVFIWKKVKKTLNYVQQQSIIIKIIEELWYYLLLIVNIIFDNISKFKSVDIVPDELLRCKTSKD